MKKFLLTVLISLPLTMFATSDNAVERQSKDPETQASKVEPDNSSRNIRDRDDQTLTPIDQSETEGDRNITQSIRRSIISSNSLSTYAKNIKIMTADGKVTLRGPVQSDTERREIVAKAKKVEGVKKIDDQLEITHRNSP